MVGKEIVVSQLHLRVSGSNLFGSTMSNPSKRDHPSPVSFQILRWDRHLSEDHCRCFLAVPMDVLQHERLWLFGISMFTLSHHPLTMTFIVSET